MTNLNISITDVNLTAQYGSIVPCTHIKCTRAIYILGKVYLDVDYKCTLVSQRTHKIQPATLVRESNTQLLRYSLDTCISFSTYLLTSSLRNAPVRPWILA